MPEQDHVELAALGLASEVLQQGQFFGAELRIRHAPARDARDIGIETSAERRDRLAARPTLH